MRSHRLRLSGWEITLIVLIVAAAAWSTYLSPYYLSLDQILYSTRQFLVPGLLALGLLVVVLTGEIDISVCSTLAVGTVLFSKFSAAAAPIWVAAPSVVVACAALGAFNGALVTFFRLPSLAVTLGAMGAYRGVAFILAGSAAYTGYTSFDDAYQYVGSAFVADVVPASLVVLALIVILTAFLVHKTVFGLRCFSIGHNAQAAWISGISTTRVRVVAYAFAGALAGLAALVWIGQYGSARGDNADGMILFIITAIVLGGADITGGAGSVPGLVLALILLGTLRNGMGLANIGGPIETVTLGVLLVLGVLRPAANRLITHIARTRSADLARKPFAREDGAAEATAGSVRHLENSGEGGPYSERR